MSRTSQLSVPNSVSSLTNPDDPASIIIKHRPIISSFTTHHAIDQANRWVSACLHSHKKCGGGEQTALPARLIDLTFERIRLRSTEGLTGAYICLSYCWGSLHQSITTKENLAVREAGFSLEGFPRTVQDAANFTRKLNVRFLWIDALCIVQNDDEDRHRQIRAMGNIYKNAFLTIVASSSSSVWDGFLQKRQEPGYSVKLPIRVSSSSYGSFTIAVRKNYNHWEEHLHRRGWAFQELLLSRRMLLFGAYEMIWSCSTQKWLPSRQSHIHYQNFAQHLPPQVFGTKLHPSTSILKQQHEIWPRIVSEYSARRVREPTDRLNALVGIATELSVAWQDVYVLGLWSRVFIQNLAWSRAFRQELPIHESFGNLPSWSWLSSNYRTALYPKFRHADATVIMPLNGLQRLMTVQDLDLQCTTVYIRARALSGADFPQISLDTSSRSPGWEDLTQWAKYSLSMDVDVSSNQSFDSNISIAYWDSRTAKAPWQCAYCYSYVRHL